MDVSLWAWAGAVIAVLALLTFDFFGHVRTPHAPTLRESGLWSAVYVSLGLGFGGIVYAVWGGTYASQYFAGFITEKSLSIDNLFVFVLIMASFRVPREYQQKVLLFGIAIALAMRTVFIFLGAAVIDRYTWIFFFFGAFLLYTAWTQVKGSGHDPDEGFKESATLRLARRVIATTDDYQGDRFFVRRTGKLWATPLFIVILAIGSADLLFAVDSIPAIFGLTQETYLVFTANAFALLGLRQLFFLIDGLLDRLVYLSYGLAAILGFIGYKLIVHAMHANTLSFINGGEHVNALPEPSISFSLLFIVGVLAVTTALSLTLGKKVHSPLEHKAEAIHHQSDLAHLSAAELAALKTDRLAHLGEAEASAVRRNITAELKTREDSDS